MRFTTVHIFALLALGVAASPLPPTEDRKLQARSPSDEDIIHLNAGGTSVRGGPRETPHLKDVHRPPPLPKEMKEYLKKVERETGLQHPALNGHRDSDSK
ncbi:hypothetical protein MCOR25_009379 [Pyricularia grisea]|nr:hypothetical protein MCOR25_009379 [Pyricularia grisea]